MALGRRLINTGAEAACNTESVQPFGADNAYSSNIALYQFEDNANDTTGNYNGTASNITYTTGKYGNAAVFNGSSSKITTSLAVNDIESLSLWFYFESGTTVGRVLGTTVSSSAGNLFLEVGTNGSISISLQNLAEAGGAGTLGSTGWKHIYYDTNRNLYINGNLQTTTSSTQSFTASNVLIGALRQNFGFFNSKIDQVRFFSKTLNAQDVATLYNETSSTASNTNPLGEGAGVALYSLDYDASDAGGYYDGAPSNVDFGVGGYINTGARFNGSSSKITLPSGSPFNSSNSVKSISAWIKPNTLTSRIFSYAASDSSNSQRYFQVGWFNDLSFIRINVTQGSSSVYSRYQATITPTTDWVHILVQVTGTGKEIYVNGVEVSGSYTNSGGGSNTDWIGNVSSINNHTIGISRLNTPSYSDGLIDQVRIFSKALNQTEIDSLFAETACVHTATTTDSDYPTTNLAYYKLDNSAEDEKGSYDGTETDIEYRFGRYGQAAVFNGSSSYIDTGISSLGANFSVSIWINEDALDSGGFFGNWNGTSNDDMFWRTQSDGSLRINIDGTSNQYFGSAGDITVNTWHHIVVSFNSGTYEVYLDSNSLGTATTSNTVFSSGANFYIGDDNSGTYFDGNIDQVRIYSTALDADQVSQLYNEKPEVDTSNFKTVLYEGTGGTQYISNVGFQPDLVWIKNRNHTQSNRLYDSVRGANLQLSSNQTGGQANSGGLTSFDANGFFLDNWSSVNTNNYDYVAWTWKGGGEAVAGTGTGVTNVSISANTSAGFSIVKYTGSGTAGMNFAHGLNSTPELVIIKNLDNSTNWQVFGGSLFTRMQLDQTGDDDENLGLTITSTTIQTTQASGQEANAAWNATDDYIAYIWHSVAGYSKIGSYEGTNSTVTVSDVGFKPSFVMIKNIDDSADWVMLDNRRNTIDDRLNNWLRANSSAQETGAVSTAYITVNDNGFIVANTTSLGTNSNGDTYIYMAFK